ncbi:MAG: hypothetical protein ABIQ06_04740 [Caldimonas sp.]
MRTYLSWLAVLILTACSTPYSPAVLVKGSAPFEGIGGLLERSSSVDVVMVHGMCTHTSEDARNAMKEIVRALQGNFRPPPLGPQSIKVPEVPAVEIVREEAEVAGSTIRFYGLVWSGMTKPLKDQLLYDSTGIANDCSSAEPGTCKPVRAALNGKFKDSLLNDCLADALAYQGKSSVPIRDAMVTALTQVVLEQDSTEPLVVVSASLGSKIVFDALSQMSGSKGPNGHVLTRRALDQIERRLAIVFMEANQLPILSLADQDIRQIDASTSSASPVVGLLKPLEQLARARSSRQSELSVVAFTDPNDLLSYRLFGSRFVGLDRIRIADVVVSNSPTLAGQLENPSAAHLGYARNKDVARMIACGAPNLSTRCK